MFRVERVVATKATPCDNRDNDRCSMIIRRGTAYMRVSVPLEGGTQQLNLCMNCSADMYRRGNPHLRQVAEAIVAFSH